MGVRFFALVADFALQSGCCSSLIQQELFWWTDDLFHAIRGNIFRINDILNHLGDQNKCSASGPHPPASEKEVFIFRGVSQVAAESPKSAAEFLIATVGPLTSFALAAFFLFLGPLLVSIRRP